MVYNSLSYFYFYNVLDRLPVRRVIFEKRVLFLIVKQFKKIILKVCIQ
jgi:hypothetical protein